MWPSWQPRLGLHTHVTPNLELPSHDQRPRDLPTHGWLSSSAPSPNQNQYKAELPNFRFNDLPVATAGDAGGEKIRRVAPALAWPGQLSPCQHHLISGQKMHENTLVVCGIRHEKTFPRFQRQTLKSKYPPDSVFTSINTNRPSLTSCDFSKGDSKIF